MKFVKYSFDRIKNIMIKNDRFEKVFSKFIKIMEIKLLIQKERLHFDRLILEGKKMKGNFSEKAFAFLKIKNFAVKINPRNPETLYAFEIIVNTLISFSYLCINKVLLFEKQSNK